MSDKIDDQTILIKAKNSENGIKMFFNIKEVIDNSKGDNVAITITNDDLKLAVVIGRNHNNSLISRNEKDFIEKIKEGHGISQNDALKKLCWVSLICIFFMGVEIAGGILSSSLAILSDAAHMFSDFSGFAISLISIYISKRKPSENMSFGYHRAEVVGALCSVLIIWILTIWLVYEGIQRILVAHYEIVGDYMLIVAIIGLLCNILMGQILHSHVYYHD
jgi:Co/Zn/Cd efflux system component